MSQAEELLATVSEGSVPATVDPSVEPHIVIDMNRHITVPSELKRIGVQFDHNIETVTFDCPRYWDGHDLSKMKIYINYRRPDGYKDAAMVDNIVVEDDIFHFDWTISGNVTAVKGQLSFLVCAKVTDTEGVEKNHWNTELNQDMYISEGLECTEQQIETYPDLITDMLLRMDIMEEDHAKKMATMEQNTSPSAMDKHVADYITENPEVMQEAVDEYMENNDQVVEHVNTFITENMDSLINAGLLEINHKARIEKSGGAAPTVEGNALLDNLEGASYQKKLSGKNLLPNNYHGNGRTENGITYTLNKDGSITISGTATYRTVYYLFHHSNKQTLPPGTYTLSCSETLPTGVSVLLGHYNPGDDITALTYAGNICYINGGNSNVNYNTSTLSAESGWLSGYINIDSGVTVNLTLRLQFELGSVATDYEPYCGGTASPNPEYPQTIHSTGDSGWFDGEWLQGYYSINTGNYGTTNDAVCSKNTIPCKSGDIVKVVTETIFDTIHILYYGENGYLSYSSVTNAKEHEFTLPSGATNFNIRIDRTNITPSTVGHVCVTINDQYAVIVDEVGKNLFDKNTVTIGKATSSDGGFYTSADFCASDFIELEPNETYSTTNVQWNSFYDINKKFVMNNNVATFIVPENVRYMRASVLTVHLDSVQIEKGSATPYTPHQHNRTYIPISEPLRSIGDIKDEICYQNGKYGVLRKCAKVVLNGSESWSDTSDLFYSMVPDAKKAEFGSAPIVYCDQYIYQKATNSNMIDKRFKLCRTSTNAVPFIWIKDLDYATTDDFKAKLQTNPITVVYVLDVPVFEPFEDQSIFWNFRSYEGATNVFIAAHENVIPVANMLLPKTIDGRLGNHAIVSTRRTEQHVEEELAANQEFVNDVLANGQIKFTIVDGKLYYQIYEEEV